MSEWKVSSQYINGEKVYQVYRNLHAGVDHSGNREYAGMLYQSEEAAREYADELNRREKHETKH